MAFNYSVSLNDPNNLSQDSALSADVTAAAAQWSQYLYGLGAIDIQVNVTPTTRANGGAATSVFVGTDGSRNVFEQGTANEIKTGIDPNGAAADLIINVDPTYLTTLWLDPGNASSIPSNEIDGLSVFLHEIGHGLGIIGWRDLTTGALPSYESTWDQLVTINADGTASFVGRNAEAIYGAPVSVTTIQNGEQYYHLGNSLTERDGQDLMNGVEFDYGKRYAISDLDLAILKDLGLTLVSVTAVIDIVPVANVHANDISRSGEVTGPYNFIDLLNLEASYSDLIHAFGTNTQAMQNWYNTYQLSEHRADTFDGLDYIASYSDLISAFKSAGSEHAVLDDGAMHFITYGSAEGRMTSFNGLDYIASYSDLIKAFGVNGDAGAYHYIENGASEGRTTTFDGLDYIASYSDLIKAFGANEQAGAAHFIGYGNNEGRATTFDGLDYIAGYTDLMTAFGANNDAGATHYIQYGLNEGRNAQAFDVAAYETAHPDLIGKYASNDAFLTAYISTYATTGKFLT